MPKVGDMVMYVCEFDADASYSPNVAPGLVTKINTNGTLDLTVFFLNGMFMKMDVPKGDGKARCTWYTR